MLDIISFFAGKTMAHGGPDTPDTPIILPSGYKKVKYMSHVGSACISVPKPNLIYLMASGKLLSTDSNSKILGYRLRNTDPTDFNAGYSTTTGLRTWQRRDSKDYTYPTPYVAGEDFVTSGILYNTRTAAFIGAYYVLSGTIYEPWNGDVYYIKGLDLTGETAFNYVPCVKEEDETPGYFEVVSGTFYGTVISNSGGKIVPGPEG